MNQSRANYLRELLLLLQHGDMHSPCPHPHSSCCTGDTSLAEGRMRFTKYSMERVLLRGRNYQTSVLKVPGKEKKFYSPLSL